MTTQERNRLRELALDALTAESSEKIEIIGSRAAMQYVFYASPTRILDLLEAAEQVGRAR